MKKIVILLLTILLPKITCFSANILEDSVIVSNNDIKYANLIFIEHQKLLEENNLLYEQLENYENEISVFEQIDSIRVSEIAEYQNLNNFYQNKIEKLEFDINKKNKQLQCWQIGGITITIGLILFILFK